jgi:prepilin-type N-terminal cleavage/methylation domain-containing protein
MDSRKRYDFGFTLIEIIAVLLLMSIIAATVLGRSINTENIDLAAQMDKVRNHYRYAHSMAMKYGDAVWGFRCANDNPREYWIFRLDPPVADPVNDPNLPGNQVQLPGETDLKVNLTSKGVSMVKFTIFFDRFGRPYLSYNDETTNTPLPNPLSISIFTTSADPIVRSFLLTPETGLIQ